MSFWVTIIVCLIIGYVFGNISPAYIVGHLNNIDIREHGSGNAGTTNTMRVLGKKAGVIVYIGDCIKCVIAVFLMAIALENSVLSPTLVKLVTGFGVVMGHNYPYWLKFKGGKGIAVTSAVILIVSLPKEWLCPLIALIAFILILKFTKYVSVGSMAIVAIFSTYTMIVNFGKKDYVAICVFAVLFLISAVYSHRANISRLIKGTENKIGSEKSSNQSNMVENDNYQNNDYQNDNYQNNNYQDNNYQNNNYQDDNYQGNDYQNNNYQNYDDGYYNDNYNNYGQYDDNYNNGEYYDNGYYDDNYQNYDDGYYNEGYQEDYNNVDYYDNNYQDEVNIEKSNNVEVLPVEENDKDAITNKSDFDKSDFIEVEENELVEVNKEIEKDIANVIALEEPTKIVMDKEK